MFDIKKWSQEFFSQYQNPMSELESKLMMAAIFGGKDYLPDEVKKAFSYQVASTRAEFMGIEYDKNALAFVSLIAKTPGAIVMYLSAFKAAGLTITMDSVVKKFPMGFPSEESLTAMWGKQKGNEVDNELDAIKWDEVAKA